MLQEINSCKAYIVISYDVKNDTQYFWLALPCDEEGFLTDQWTEPNVSLLRQNLVKDWGVPYIYSRLSGHHLRLEDIMYIKTCRLKYYKTTSIRLATSESDERIFAEIQDLVQEATSIISASRNSVAKVKTISVNLTPYSGL